MGKLAVFNFITLNGFFKGPDGDISWHRHGGEEGEYSAEMLRTGSTLLFGRVTYGMMESFWPTEQAAQMFPVVAEGMNRAEKIVFSRTLDKVGWNNSRLVKNNIFNEVRKMKQEGKNMAVLGSGSIITQFAEQGLIDEYQIMVDPVAIGEGTPMFNGMKNKLDLELTGTRTFSSGVVLLFYKPMAG